MATQELDGLYCDRLSRAHITAFVDRTNGVAIVEIEDSFPPKFAFLDSLQFHVAYHTGSREVADYTVTANAPLCNDSLGPSSALPHPEALVTSPAITFEFPVTPNRPYQLFYAVNGGDPIARNVGSFTSSPARVTLTLPPGRINWWTSFNPPNCQAQQSSIFAFENGPPATKRRASRR